MALPRVITPALIALAALLTPACGPDYAAPDPGYENFRVTGFELVDEKGGPVDASILDNRFTVLDFFFTNCPIYCPTMGAVMRRVQDATQGDHIRLLSISVDGVNDTPDAIARYARDLGADPARWTFLTGPPERTRALAEEQLKLGVTINKGQQVALPSGGTMDFIDHPTRLILIGPDRRVLGMYSYAREDEIQLLIQRLRRLPAP